jgi:hypothetical protein
MSAETPHSLAEKKFHNLQPLTPGSRYCGIYAQQVSIDDHLAVHGYSLLRTQLNNDYFRDIFDYAARFNIAVEGHRACITYSSLRVCDDNTLNRHRDWSRSFRDRPRLYQCSSHGRQRLAVQISR